MKILLSTYNGSRYLSSQLDSILNQSYQDFQIIIRDDGSQDDTKQILEYYQKKHPDKIKLINDSLGNIGVAKSFRELMKNSKSEFYLFADQDDIWHNNKLELLLSIAKTKSTSEIPYLIFSNMIMFYENSNKSADFFKKYKISDKKVTNGLFQGAISGCLMLFNHSLKSKCIEINDSSPNLHDWDVIMTAYMFGKIDLVDDVLIKHRIHNNNAVGEGGKKNFMILLKDFAKYSLQSANYRKIVLEPYFKYLDGITNKVDKNLLLKKELLNEKELSKMNYFNRKKWFIKHFNPFLYGKVNGCLLVLTF